MKRSLFIVMVFLITLCITGCSKKQPDEYYVNKFKQEFGLESARNIVCSVNTISDDQVKVTCSYEQRGNCLVWSARSYAGCQEYQYVTTSKEKIYDIEYKD